MESELPVRKSAILITVGLTVFILYLYFFVGFDEILDVFKRVNPVEYAFYYSITFAAIMLSVLFYSMTWNEFLKTLSIHIGLRKAFVYNLIANFVDLIIPLEAITGEFTRVYLISKDTNNQFGKAVASVVTHRIVSNFFALSALIISSIILIRYAENLYVSYLLVLVITGTAASIVILFYLSVREEAAERLVNGLIRVSQIFTRDRLKIRHLRDSAIENLSFFHQGFRTVGNDPKNLIKPMIYTSVSWFCHLVIYFLVFYALGYTGVLLFVPQIIIVFSISLATQTIPVGLPVGLVEIVMTSLYTLFGIPPALGGTATTLIRVVTFWFQIMLGYVVVQWMGIRTLVKNRNDESP